MAHKFAHGQILATPGVIAEVNPWFVIECIRRHLSGDWGDVLCAEDKAMNDAALTNGDRILSAYKDGRGTKFYIITEAVDDNGQREATVCLLPSEY